MLHRRAQVERELRAYGWTWVTCAAQDAGLPHLRRRVFAVGVRGGSQRGVIEAPTGGRWTVDRLWPTPAARDYKTGSGIDRNGSPPLSYEGPQFPAPPQGSRLNPEWVELLMGFPAGWTFPKGQALQISTAPPIVRGRYPETWDRRVPWPGFDWEPSRTLPDGPPCPGRPNRLRALGNAVCPQQGLLALRAALTPTQTSLL